MKRVLYRVVILLCILGILVSGYQLYGILSEYAKGKAVYDDTAQRYTTQADEPDLPAEDTSGMETGTEHTPPITVDFDRLLEENPDVVGWLYCEGTPINYPILQGADNEVYLHRMIDGSYNSAGSLFMDYRCSPDFSSLHTILYGHNMKNKSMFGTLRNYKEQSYYDLHPSLWLLTPTENIRIDLVAGLVLPADSGLYQTISDEEQLQSCLSQALDESTFLSDVEISEHTQLITLSTCSYEYDEARYVLLGVPVPVE